MRVRGEGVLLLCLLVLFLLAPLCSAQTERATVSGRVVDPSNAAVPAATITIENKATNATVTAHTNGEGIFVSPNLVPGKYRVKVEKEGFQTMLWPDVVLHVQDVIALNFQMKVGSRIETVTVSGQAPLIDESPAVSTVVDHNFVDNLPLNGRSFQSLLLLTPGVTMTSVNSGSLGQFSVNGQRADANYVTVDGVSANFGMSTSYFMAESLGGAVPATNVLGGYNSLVSVDAMQEFRIQTSTYAPEFGREPGGQVSIVTRSGSNSFHGTAFDYLRNDVFDARDYFNRNCFSGTCTEGRKPPLRQNDFGGVFGGPIVKDKAFFFFSYEGLRLRKPNVLNTMRVPSLELRNSAPASQQPLLNMFPLPTPGGQTYSDGSADYSATWSDPGWVNAYAGRVDVNLRKNLTLFGRYNYSPSRLDARCGGINGTSACSEVDSNRMNIQTLTAGLTWLVSPTQSNDIRFNYSRDKTDQVNTLDTFGGAVVPADSYLFPNNYATLQTGVWAECVVAGCDSIHHEFFQPGHWNNSLNQAFNIVDSYSIIHGGHALKFGADIRRNSMWFWPFQYFIEPYWTDLNQIATGQITYGAQTRVSIPSSVRDYNFGFYGQDTWKVSKRLTLTYGLRWDIETPMMRNGGLPQLTATGLDQTDPTKVNFITTNGYPYPMRLGNVAPRAGATVAISNKPGRELIARGGYGMFYNLVSQTAGMLIYGWAAYPVSAGSFGPTTCCPFPDSFAAPAPIVFNANLGGSIYYPYMKNSYVHEFNVAFEQSLGQHQVVSLTYVGGLGRNLAQSDYVTGLGPAKSAGGYIWGLNNGWSNYHALQAQFKMNMYKGLQILTSYNWSHSIDNGSVNSFGSGSDWGTFGLNTPGFNEGPSIFDIRQQFSTALTYNLPTPHQNGFTKSVFGSWVLDNIVAARSSPPSDIGANIYSYIVAGTTTSLFVRPDIVPGQPLYLTGPQYPGGKAINLAAFAPPPSTSTTAYYPARNGDAERNLLRNFPASQWDVAVHRNFNVTERLGIQFRMEAFNVLNHPNFGYFGGSNSTTQAVTLSYAMLAGSPYIATPGPVATNSTLSRSLNGVYGGVNPLYSIGGPRSMQAALKLTF